MYGRSKNDCFNLICGTTIIETRAYNRTIVDHTIQLTNIKNVNLGIEPSTHMYQHV